MHALQDDDETELCPAVLKVKYFVTCYVIISYSEGVRKDELRDPFWESHDDPN